MEAYILIYRIEIFWKKQPKTLVMKHPYFRIRRMVKVKGVNGCNRLFVGGTFCISRLVFGEPVTW